MNRLIRILCIALLVFQSCDTLHAQMISSCRDPYDFLACDRNIIIVRESDYQANANNIYVQILIEYYGILPNCTPCIVNTYNYQLSDPAFFENLGTQVLQLSGGPHTVRGFRLIPPSYPTPPGYQLMITPILTGLPSGTYWPFLSYIKKCGNCLDCFSRYQLYSLYQHLSGTIFEDLEPQPFPGYSGLTLPADKQAVVSILNWFLNIPVAQPTTTDWENVMEANNLHNTSAPSAFCQFAQECPCWYEIRNYYSTFIDNLITDWDINSPFFGPELYTHLTTGCTCSGFYCYSFTSENFPNGQLQSLTINLIPVHQGSLPALIIHIELDAGVFYSTLAYAFDFLNLNINCNPQFLIAECIPISVNYSGGQFTYTNNFRPIDELIEDGCDPPPPCIQCISTFSPLPDSTYIITVWAKEDNASPTKTSYDAPQVEIEFDDIGGALLASAGPFAPAGPIIDGWQKIEGKFTVPTLAAKFRLLLESNSTDSYFDDVRIVPENGSMKTFVYDPVNLRLVAILDEQHYATLFEYDEDGKLIRTKKETERGIMTINENRSSILKK